MDTEKIKKLEKQHYKLTFKINTLLLGAHVCLIALFAYLHVTLMVWVNVLSIGIYVGLYFYYKKNLVNYVFVVIVEVLWHMTLATISVGWEAGFQLYCFVLIPCIYLCDYLSHADGRGGMHPRLISTIIVCVFGITRLHSYYGNVLYQVDEPDAFVGLFMYNALVTFIFLIIYMDVFRSRILSRERMLADMAELDQLTKLPNRYLMKGWLEDAYEVSSHENTMSVAMLDIDDFKMLNDRFGHAAGDKALQDLAMCIKDMCGERFQCCRWGGEEFLVLAAGNCSYAELRPQLEKLRTEIGQMKIIHETEQIRMTVTIGVTELAHGDRHYEEVVKRADMHLYEGKRSGKNCVIGDR